MCFVLAVMHINIINGGLIMCFLMSFRDWVWLLMLSGCALMIIWTSFTLSHPYISPQPKTLPIWLINILHQTPR